MSDNPCPVQLFDYYQRAVRECAMAYSPIAKAAATKRRNILANLVINDARIDPSIRVRTATAQCEVLGNDTPMMAFKGIAA